MGISLLNVGQRRTLNKRLKKALVNSAIAASVVAASFSMLESKAFSGGETRSISLYHIHTGERLSVTYMENGRYVPSAMKQINYLLRDWRKNKTVMIDPKTIDLVWELHEDLGSHGVINIVCGYRSAATNALLKRIGRNVAERSQHIVGKAIDFYFPDIPTVKIRNSALVRKVGGVGYYRSAGGPTGFLHVDSGHVRHWGPVIGNVQMAQIMREGMKTVGRRLRLNGGNQQYEAAPDATGGNGGLLAFLGFKKKPAIVQVQQVAVAKVPAPRPVEAAYSGDTNDMADLSADAAVAPATSKPKAIMASIVPPTPLVPKDQIAALNALADDVSKTATPAEEQADNGAAEPLVKKGPAIPRPRLKPVEIMLMAAANMKADPTLIRISAASAPPPSQTGNDEPSPVADSLGTVMAAAAEEPIPVTAKSTKALKGNFATQLRNGTAENAPVIKPVLASAGGSDINWWPQLFLNGDAAIRRDGAPPVIGATGDSTLPMAATLNEDGNDVASADGNSEGKGDLLVVNREGKGDLSGFTLPTTHKTQKLSFN